MSETCFTSWRPDGACVIEIHERTVGPRRALVTVVGEVDQSTCAHLQSALVRVWESRPVAVAVDLRQVTFLNAGGLRSLLLASGTARAGGVPFVLQAGPGQVSRLLTMVGLGEQIVSSAELHMVFATAATGSWPALRLVAPADVGADPGSPSAVAPPTGSAPRGGLRRVPTLRSVPSGGDDGGAAGTARVVPAPVAAGRRAALCRALSSRELVGRATGMLMQRDKITADQALDALTVASREQHRSIVEVAEELIGTRPA